MTEQAKREVCGQGGCQRPVDPDTGAFEGCAEHRALFDAQADHEEWSHAQSILDPMAAIAREVGNASLSKVMDKALAEVEGEVNRIVDVLERLRGQAQ